MMQTNDVHPFPHHRLDAYNVALQMAKKARKVADRVPRGYRSFADQLLRAAGGVVLLIGEGANRFSAPQKVQRFGEARAECGEAAAAAELLATLSLIPTPEAQRLCELAGRVAAMLTGLIRRLS